MKKSRLTEAKIIGCCANRKLAVRRRRFAGGTGISEQNFYRWKAKYSGMTVSDAQKLKMLADENRRLWKLLAGSILDVGAVNSAISNRGHIHPRPQTGARSRPKLNVEGQKWRLALGSRPRPVGTRTLEGRGISP